MVAVHLLNRTPNAELQMKPLYEVITEKNSFLGCFHTVDCKALALNKNLKVPTAYLTPSPTNSRENIPEVETRTCSKIHLSIKLI